MKKILSAALVALASAGSAHAALITRTYEVTFNVPDAPLAQKNGMLSYTITYDPTVTVNDVAATSYMSSNSAPVFQTTTPGYSVFANSALLLGTINPSGVNGVSTQTDDFYVIFGIDNKGNFNPSSMFNNGGFRLSVGNYFGSSSVSSVRVIDPNAPVPEPATWAMFIGGFGFIGAAMRRRRVSVSFA
jgi:hypothetical protein